MLYTATVQSAIYSEITDSNQPKKIKVPGSTDQTSGVPRRVHTESKRRSASFQTPETAFCGDQ